MTSIYELEKAYNALEHMISVTEVRTDISRLRNERQPNVPNQFGSGQEILEKFHSSIIEIFVNVGPLGRNIWRDHFRDYDWFQLRKLENRLNGEFIESMDAKTVASWMFPNIDKADASLSNIKKLSDALSSNPSWYSEDLDKIALTIYGAGLDKSDNYVEKFANAVMDFVADFDDSFPSNNFFEVRSKVTGSWLVVIGVAAVLLVPIANALYKVMSSYNQLQQGRLAGEKVKTEKLLQVKLKLEIEKLQQDEEVKDVPFDAMYKFLSEKRLEPLVECFDSMAKENIFVSVANHRGVPISPELEKLLIVAEESKLGK